MSLSGEVAALETTAFGWLLQSNIHGRHFRCHQSCTIRIIAMRQSDQTLMQIAFAATVAFLQEAGRCDNGRLNLAIAQAFAFVHLHFAVASSLQTSELIIFLCKWTICRQNMINHLTDYGLVLNLPLIKWISDGRVSQISSPLCCPKTQIVCKQITSKMAVNAFRIFPEPSLSVMFGWTPAAYTKCIITRFFGTFEVTETNVDDDMWVPAFKRPFYREFESVNPLAAHPFWPRQSTMQNRNKQLISTKNQMSPRTIRKDGRQSSHSCGEHICEPCDVSD